eukprot:CAMPEP_0181223976 /NCGR_PEP_ID=MMETSP1096-20121128/30858_1 /TAXON_ID=156174 ORGANISM="Chrysochromulina ericina, Strain CCMP281" /NCGR_SAMPLE_ID=MMETSP1096 /ASSEMBLY_ACC=CAM_ASM_000453 /LENGTH=202 /DNA_ID=CAMNT_0023316983 /DNA_START=133 /DNA_END=739 /DNA_ORIENTATION=-
MGPNIGLRRASCGAQDHIPNKAHRARVRHLPLDANKEELNKLGWHPECPVAYGEVCKPAAGTPSGFGDGEALDRASDCKEEGIIDDRHHQQLVERRAFHSGKEKLVVHDSATQRNAGHSCLQRFALATVDYERERPVLEAPAIGPIEQDKADGTHAIVWANLPLLGYRISQDSQGRCCGHLGLEWVINYAALYVSTSRDNDD